MKCFNKKAMLFSIATKQLLMKKTIIFA